MVNKTPLRWWMHDVPEAQTPGGHQPIIWPNFYENCMKMRKTELRKGCAPSGGFRGAHPARPPPLRPKIFSISCSFLENLTKLYVGAPLEGWRPLLQGILDPPLAPNVDPPLHLLVICEVFSQTPNSHLIHCCYFLHMIYVSLYSVYK